MSYFNLCLCDSCGLNDPALNKVQMFRPLSEQFNILAIGQAPGEVENTLKRPFCGPAGKMLWRLMKEAGLDRDRIYLSNVCSCWPPKDRTPSRKEVECCLPRLIQEIHEVKPELIIAFGGPALETLTGKSGIEASRGSFFPLLSQFNHTCQVFACYHPSFVMRQRQWINPVVSDLKEVVKFFITGPKRISISNTIQPEFIIDPSYTELSAYLNRIKQDDITVYDLETTGLNPRKDEVIGDAFCFNPNEAVAVYLTPGDPRWELIKRFKEDKHTKLCVQNGSYDYKMLYPLGIKTQGIVHDTRLAETLIHPDMPKNLQAMRVFYTNIHPYKPSAKEMKVIGSWNKEKVLTMGCWDVITTFKVMEKQLPLMTDKEKDLQQTLLIPLIEVFEHMERKGLNVNINTLAGLYAKGFPEVEALNQEIQNEIGINPGSPKQICQYFNLNDSQEDTLAYHIKRDHVHSRLFQKILDFRGKQKALSTYLKGIYERLEDNRIHTEYKIEGTGTGRPSSSNPNLANVPKELRVIYIPDSPDFLFIEVDKSQLELRVGALIAPEPTLLDELSQGADIHERTRLSILDAYPGFAAFGSRQRLITKSVVFGTFYGRTAMSIAREFGIPVAVAEKIQAVCINKYKGFHDYKTRCERAVAKDGLLTTAFGRRRIVNTLNQGYNTPVQSAAADVGLTTLLNLFKAGLDLRITVYDSYLIQVPKHKAKEYQEEIINIAQLPFDIFNGYSFPVKAKQGSDWYNLKEIVYA